MKIVALIPARYGSKRLKEKNIRLVNGKPMISYAIDACKRSQLIDTVYVSTESSIIADVAEQYGAIVINRPEEFAEDKVRSQDVFEHFANEVTDFDILVVVQANSPNVQTANIENGIQKMIDNDLWEVRSVSSSGLENGAIWILKRDTIFWQGLSVHFGVVTDDAVDIHTLADLKKAEGLLKNG